jgi:hypothetical protein
VIDSKLRSQSQGARNRQANMVLMLTLVRSAGFSYLMESWILLLIVTRGSETVPVRVPMSGYEQCMAAGHYAEIVASKLKDVKVNWTCQSSQ